MKHYPVIPHAMSDIKKAILTVNGGSSSIKFAVYNVADRLESILSAEVKKIGTANAEYSFANHFAGDKEGKKLGNISYEAVSDFVVEYLERQTFFSAIEVVGHRIVHGMHHTQPEIVTDSLLNELKNISAFDPEHLPEEIKLIELFRSRFPKFKQVACFDTVFHAGMPTVAKLLPLPAKYRNMGIQRYGFHGLSYAYLLHELERIAGKADANAKVIMAHLGSGSSIAAVNNGKSIDTSMGFTPTGGLPMSTRTGDLDPGIIVYLLQKEKLESNEFSHLINHESGLLGISETSGDMETLLKNAVTDEKAANAVDFFCYQAKKWIGSFAAALGGLDTLIFSGGIGEHSAEIRKRICENLLFLGVDLDEDKNKGNEPIISASLGKVTVRVITTDEEWMIANLVCGVMEYKIKT